MPNSAVIGPFLWPGEANNSHFQFRDVTKQEVTSLLPKFNVTHHGPYEFYLYAKFREPGPNSC